jgi:hypothetical protein
LNLIGYGKSITGSSIPTLNLSTVRVGSFIRVTIESYHNTIQFYSVITIPTRLPTPPGTWGNRDDWIKLNQVMIGLDRNTNERTNSDDGQS